MRIGHLMVILSALALLFSSGCTTNSPTSTPPGYWPTEDWLRGDPSDHGIDSAKLRAATDSIPEELPFLDSFLLIRDGYIVHDSYFNAFDETMLHDLRSVTKSWTSALIGMAQASGELVQLDASLSELLPDYFANGRHTDKQAITLFHLLAMQSGIDFDDEKMISGAYGGDEILEGDLTEFALEFPIAYDPGATWNYSSLDSQLISAIFTSAMGDSMEEFAAKHLFKPLGITDYRWQQDGKGISIGGGGLYLRPRDMAKLGYLYLHGGLWDGNQIVPADWVEQSSTPQNTKAYYPLTDQPELIEWYGLHWWTWKGDWFYGYPAFNAKGFAGQQVLVLPDLDLIIVTTANADAVPPDVGGMQEEEIANFIHDSILPTLRDIDAN
jgi:CubicO group peptidase (beta-lactamase class C family)